MKPKILVGCPTYELFEYCLDKYSKAINSLTYSNYDILLVDNSKEDNYLKKIKSLNLTVKKCPYSNLARARIVASMNILRDYVLKNNYDYLLSLEQDIIPPKDVIQQLLKHNKKIISGVYFVYQNQYSTEQQKYLIPVAWVTDEEFSIGNLDGVSVRLMHPKETEENKVIKVVSCGTGCLLIHRDILEKIKFRYDEFFPYFHDNWFCRDAFYQGFDVWMDTSIKCKHLINNKPFSWANIKK